MVANKESSCALTRLRECTTSSGQAKQSAENLKRESTKLDKHFRNCKMETQFPTSRAIKSVVTPGRLAARKDKTEREILLANGAPTGTNPSRAFFEEDRISAPAAFRVV
jgi:hypothetical protein